MRHKIHAKAVRAGNRQLQIDRSGSFFMVFLFHGRTALGEG